MTSKRTQHLWVCVFGAVWHLSFTKDKHRPYHTKLLPLLCMSIHYDKSIYDVRKYNKSLMIRVGISFPCPTPFQLFQHFIGRQAKMCTPCAFKVKAFWSTFQLQGTTFTLKVNILFPVCVTLFPSYHLVISWWMFAEKSALSVATSTLQAAKPMIKRFLVEHILCNRFQSMTASSHLQISFPLTGDSQGAADQSRPVWLTS